MNALQRALAARDGKGSTFDVWRKMKEDKVSAQRNADKEAAFERKARLGLAAASQEDMTGYRRCVCGRKTPLVVLNGLRAGKKIELYTICETCADKRLYRTPSYEDNGDFYLGKNYLINQETRPFVRGSLLHLTLAQLADMVANQNPQIGWQRFMAMPPHLKDPLLELLLEACSTDTIRGRVKAMVTVANANHRRKLALQAKRKEEAEDRAKGSWQRAVADAGLSEAEKKAKQARGRVRVGEEGYHWASLGPLPPPWQRHKLSLNADILPYRLRHFAHVNASDELPPPPCGHVVVTFRHAPLPPPLAPLSSPP